MGQLIEIWETYLMRMEHELQDDQQAMGYQRAEVAPVQEAPQVPEVDEESRAW
jgi:hypothetical protein